MGPPPEATPVSSRRAGSAAVSVTTVGVLPAYMIGVLWVQLRDDLGFGPSLLGTLIACFFVSSALSSFAGGTMVRRFGTSGVVRSSALIGAASLLAISVAAQYMPVLVAALVVAGFGNGVGQPASNDLIARAVASNRHGLAYGTKQAAIPLATMVSGIAVPLIAIPLGWRPAFAIGAGLALLVMLLVPRASGLRPPGSSEPSEAAGPFRRAPLFVLAAGLMFGTATGNSLGAFFVATAVDSGIGPGTAGVLAAVASGTGALARIGLGWLADRVRARWLYVVAAQMAIGGLAYALLGTGVEALVAAGAVIGYCTGWAWAGLSTYSVARMHPGMAARATSITQAGMGAGAAVGPFVFGLVVSATSYPVAWYGTAVVAVLGGAIIVQARRMLMRERPGLVAAQRQRRAARQ